MIEKIMLIFGPWAFCAFLAFIWRAKAQTSDFAIITLTGILAMLASAPFVPLSKDGYFDLLYTIPFLALGLFGGAIGCAAARHLRKEQKP